MIALERRRRTSSAAPCSTTSTSIFRAAARSPPCRVRAARARPPCSRSPAGCSSRRAGPTSYAGEPMWQGTGDPRPGGRVRAPGLRPGADPVRAGERLGRAARPRRTPAEEPTSGPRRRWPASTSPTSATARSRSCPAARCSGSRGARAVVDARRASSADEPTSELDEGNRGLVLGELLRAKADARRRRRRGHPRPGRRGRCATTTTGWPTGAWSTSTPGTDAPAPRGPGARRTGPPAGRDHRPVGRGVRRVHRRGRRRGPAAGARAPRGPRAPGGGGTVRGPGPSPQDRAGPDQAARRAGAVAGDRCGRGVGRGGGGLRGRRPRRRRRCGPAAARAVGPAGADRSRRARSGPAPDRRAGRRRGSRGGRGRARAAPGLDPAALLGRTGCDGKVRGAGLRDRGSRDRRARRLLRDDRRPGQPRAWPVPSSWGSRRGSWSSG